MAWCAVEGRREAAETYDDMGFGRIPACTGAARKHTAAGYRPGALRTVAEAADLPDVATWSCQHWEIACPRRVPGRSQNTPITAIESGASLGSKPLLVQRQCDPPRETGTPAHQAAGRPGKQSKVLNRKPQRESLDPQTRANRPLHRIPAQSRFVFTEKKPFTDMLISGGVGAAI